VNGANRLDKVIDELKSQVKPGQVIWVEGYACRLGPAGYNRLLSKNPRERGHQSVERDRSDEKAPSRIRRPNRRGSTKSLTGKLCDGKTGEDLRKCLTPDRRVEIFAK
jgi:OOP family OmpA-OmpF porin